VLKPVSSTLVQVERQAVPSRALAISVAALAIPVAAAFWLPDWTGNSFGMLIWLTALIPAFLLSYYRGLAGVAFALAGGMAVITATQVSIVAFDVGEPNWTLLAVIVSVYLAVSIGIAGLSEVLRRERQVAQELALIDLLTGLPNRRHVDITLPHEFAAAERGKNLTVVIFDLDRFKLVNDKHGHAVGDRTIQSFARILRNNTRKENLSARFGGEEFVSILRDATAEAAIIFARRVLDQMRELPVPWGKQTVSAGIAQFESGMGSYELLLSAADQALYEAKGGGRDMICVAPRKAARTSAASVAAPGRVATAAPQPADGIPPPARGRRLLYVVDDDADVRILLKRILTGRGYDVWDTGKPADAIRHYTDASRPARPDLILSDVLMPEMTGMRMIDQIALLDPAVKVIYMSGNVQSNISWPGTQGGEVVFLEKPIETEKLLAAIEGMIAPHA
jgi:diguanylate cyclase (GGDEF)-like protein